jgi:CTP:molybdopterin cytidylyltransferase MocA
VIVVLGAAAERILLAIEDLTHGPVEVRINPAWREGMGSSIRTGIAAIFEADVSGVLMLTCDQPFVTVEHLRGLSRRDPGSATASAYAGRRGVPAYLPRTMFGELTGLTGDAGARSLLREAEALELPFGELDVDTAESLAAVRAHWGACESSGRAS